MLLIKNDHNGNGTLFAHTSISSCTFMPWWKTHACTDHVPDSTLVGRSVEMNLEEVDLPGGREI